MDKGRERGKVEEEEMEGERGKEGEGRYEGIWRVGEVDMEEGKE